MTAAEAAFHFLHLEATVSTAAAISFAQSYENSASTEDFANYLDILETQITGVDLDVAA